MAWDAFPNSYDPRYGTDAHSFYLEDLIHCSLTGADEGGNVTYRLAKSASWKDDKTLELKLRNNFKFSDGAVVKPSDVKASYDFFLQEDTKSPRALAFRNLSRVEASENSVTFYLKDADASFVTNLVVGILPESEAFSERIDQKRKFPTCGPFVYRGSNLSEIHLEKNPYSPEVTEETIPKVQIKIVKDESTRFSKLRKGELDLVQNGVSYQKLLTLDEYPELKVIKSSGLNTAYLGFNFKHPLLKKKKVREALSYAVQKDVVIEYVLKGMGQKADSLLTPGSEYFLKDRKKDSYNPQKASQILDEAGYSVKKGEKYRFTLKLTFPQNETSYAVARALASDFEKIGIKLETQTFEWGKFKKEVEKGRVDMWLLSWIGFKDPDIYRYVFAKESFPPNGGNRGWYENRDLDLLLEKGSKMINFSERKKTYFEVQKIIAEDRPYLFLYHKENTVVFRKNIEGFRIFADGRYSSLVSVTKK